MTTGVYGAHFWLALHHTLGGTGADEKLRGPRVADFVYSALADRPQGTDVDSPATS